MTVLLESLRANISRETEGDWVEIPDVPGVRLRVRSLNAPAFRVARDQALQRLAAKYPRGGGVEAEEEVFRLHGRLYAEHILLDWEGLDEAYAPARAFEILTDPSFRMVQRCVEYAAAKLAEIEVRYLEDVAKN